MAAAAAADVVRERFPKRFYDVGLAEPHAVTFVLTSGGVSLFVSGDTSDGPTLAQVGAAREEMAAAVAFGIELILALAVALGTSIVVENQPGANGVGRLKNPSNSRFISLRKSARVARLPPSMPVVRGKGCKELLSNQLFQQEPMIRQAI